MTRITDDPVADADDHDFDVARTCARCHASIDKGTLCSDCASDRAFDDFKRSRDQKGK